MAEVTPLGRALMTRGMIGCSNPDPNPNPNPNSDPNPNPNPNPNPTIERNQPYDRNSWTEGVS